MHFPKQKNPKQLLTPQDAFDAMGYFHLALAAALEDGGSLQAKYIIYMKLAEIHANYLPDAELSQRYMDSAQSLKRELAGHTDSSDTDEEYIIHAATENDDAKLTTHSTDGSRSSDFRSRSSTLVGSTMMDTSCTITTQKEAGIETDYICGEDMETCGPRQHTMSETRHTDERLCTSHTDSSLLCTEF